MSYRFEQRPTNWWDQKVLCSLTRHDLILIAILGGIALWYAPLDWDFIFGLRYFKQ